MSLWSRIFSRDRATAPASFGRDQISWWPTNDAPIPDEQGALQVSAVWSAVRLIAESIAALPWQLFERDGTARNVLDGHNTTLLLNRAPNAEMSAFDARAMLTTSALLRGNGYAEIERDLRGQPVALWPIMPDRVKPHRNRDTGAIVYVVDRRDEVPARDMYHLKGPTLNGLTGLSVIEQARFSIATGRAADQFAHGFFENGTHVGAVLKVPGTLKTDGRENLENSLKRYRGANNRGKALILEQGVEYMAIGIPPEDAQFIEQRRFNVSEIARWFRVPPHKIGDLEKATFSNIEQQAREFVDDALLPWCARLEQEADRKLLGAKQRPRLFSRINLRGLLRGDSQAQANFFKQMFDMGVYSQNDIRQLLDENPIPEGDHRFVQLNLQTVEQATAEPEAEPAGFDDTIAARVFAEVFDRLHRREAGRIADGQDIEQFEQQHCRYAFNALKRAAGAVFGEAIPDDELMQVCAQVEAAAAVERAADERAGEPVSRDATAAGARCLETLRNALKVTQ